MTDKQIIIDGKECRYWFRPNPSDYRKCSLRGKNDNCDEINDCFIKELLGKLARKEQECEELKQTLTEIKPILEFYANSNMGEEQPDKTYHIMLNGSYIMVYDPKPARQAVQKISEVEEQC